VVSPVNARKLLSAFIAGAKKELLIYDPKVSDLQMMRLLEQRAAAGVQIRLIGRLAKNISGVRVSKLSQMRLHTRTLVRDGESAFLGSQSLRAVELDARREVGLIFREPKVVSRLYQIFTDDWTLAEQAAERTGDHAPADKVAKRVAKLLTKDLREVAPVLEGAVREIVGGDVHVELDPAEVEAAVKGAVKTAVKDVVSDLVEDAVGPEGDLPDEAPAR